MKDCKCNSKDYTVEDIHNVEIDDLSTLPDYLFGLREVEDPSDGTTIIAPVRVPTSKIAPTGGLANVIALATNNDSLTVPENQVRAGYIDVQPGGNIMRFSDANNPAQFLMLGNYTNGKMLIQSTGFLYIAGGHSYIPSVQYYASDDGTPTTDGSVTGQKLFIALDDHYLTVNMGA